MPDLLKNLLLTMFESKNRESIFTVYCGPASQSIGRGRISREGALDVRESRERRDKIFAEKIENANFFQKKMDQEQQFSMGKFSFFWLREN